MADRLSEIELWFNGAHIITSTDYAVSLNHNEWLIAEVHRLRTALGTIAFKETGHFEQSPRGIAIRALEGEHGN